MKTGRRLGTARFGGATLAYFAGLGFVALSPLVEIWGIPEPAVGIFVAVGALVVHIAYGAMTRTWWACGIVVLLPIIAFLLAPDDPDMPSYPAALAFGAVMLAPWLAGLIAVGVAWGRGHAG